MSTSGDQNKAGEKSDFMAAEEIKTILGGREKSEQERIIRWVSESLAIVAIPTAGSTTSTQIPSPSGSSVSLTGDPTGTSARPADMKSFVHVKKPRSDVQFAAVVAYYYCFEAPVNQRKEAISGPDLQESARLAGYSRFKTPSIPLNNAVTQGYLDRAGRGSYKINAVGENLVAMTLPGTGSDGIDGGRRRKNNSKPKSTKKTK